MLTVGDVLSSLVAVIGDSMFGDGEKVINLSDGSFIYVNTFAAFYQDADGMNSASLLAINHANNHGHTDYINEWKEKGYTD